MIDAGTKYTDKQLNRIEKTIKDVYGEAHKEIEKKMKDFNFNFLNNEFPVWQRKLDNGEITQEQYDKWFARRLFQSQQWQSKEEQIANVLYNANREATNIINGGKISVFAENANWTAYTLEHGAGINFGFGLYDETAVTNLIKNQPNLLPKKNLNKEKDIAWNMKKISNQVAQTIVQGENIEKLSKRMATVTGQNWKAMLTHARTAYTGAQNAGRYQRLSEAKDMGINVVKEWMATLDGRTRDSHRHMDGEQVKVGDKWHPFKFSNNCRFPGDPEGPPWEVYNCRCTLVGDITDYPSKYERYDNIDGKPIKNMTYDEWEKAKQGVVEVNPIQSQIGAARTVAEVNSIMNSQGWWKDTQWGVEEADLDGCDLDSAKSIASAYQQVFERFPQLKGKFRAPDAHPVGMKDNTYAWCYTRDGGRVQVNPIESKYGNWNNIVKQYEKDVLSRWHPEGTTAESIVVHEIGHAIDGLLAREGILGGITSSGQYRYASSSLKNTIMNRAAEKDEIIAKYWNAKDWNGKADKFWQSEAIGRYVSNYAEKNNKEWFAECFAEYITSANPRIVADEFGKELEKLLGRLT